MNNLNEEYIIEKLNYLSHSLKEKNKEIYSIRNSFLWKMSYPLRAIQEAVSYAKNVIIKFSEQTNEVGRKEALKKVIRTLGIKVSETKKTNEFTIEEIKNEISFAIKDNTNIHNIKITGGAKITWITEGLITSGGGHRNIIRIANYLSLFGHDVTIYFTKLIDSSDKIKLKIKKNMYDTDIKIEKWDNKIDECDILVATNWTTVELVTANASKAKSLAYFVQDFEPSFYPFGSHYILAEETYKKGLFHICSGPWCDLLLKNKYGARADHFTFPIDTSIYNVKSIIRSKKQILFFAKPEMPRRCYEIGIKALEIFKSKRPEIKIVLYGSTQINNKFNFEVEIKKVLPKLTDLAELYAESTIGMVFSTTNPSLVPYEMMACGLPVVDLKLENSKINYQNSEEIALLFGPDPQEIADSLLRIIEDEKELKRRSEAGVKFAGSFPTEEQSARKVEEMLLALL